MTNKKVLAEERKRFKKLVEWSFVPSGIEEDDDNQMDNEVPQDNNNGQTPPMGQDSQQPPIDMGGGDMNQDIQGGDGNMNGDMNQSMNMGQDSMPLMDAPIDNATDNTDSEESDDDVIDVTKLTDAQIKMNDKLKSFVDGMGNVNSSLENLMNIVDTLDKKIDDNNNQIEDLKRSIKERLPNEEEKIKKRADSGYPYSNDTRDIESVHAKDPSASKNVTAGDIANYNSRDIEQSFNNLDDLRQDITRILNF